MSSPNFRLGRFQFRKDAEEGDDDDDDDVVHIVQETPPASKKRKSFETQRNAVVIFQTDSSDSGEENEASPPMTLRDPVASRKHVEEDSSFIESPAVRMDSKRRRKAVIISSDDDDEEDFEKASFSTKCRESNANDGNKPYDSLVSVSVSTASSRAKEDNIPPQWACNKCTLLNAGRMNVCIMCGERRSTKNKDWQCERCTFLNEGDGRECEMCGSVRSKDQRRSKPKKDARALVTRSKPSVRTHGNMYPSDRRPKTTRSVIGGVWTQRRRLQKKPKRSRRRVIKEESDDEDISEGIWDSEASETASSGREHADSDESSEEEEDQIEPLLKKCREIREKLDSKLNEDARVLIESVDLRGNLPHPLKKYQMFGLRWLYNLHHHGFSGILADQMGLGKTVQTCALLTSLRISAKQIRGPHLIVVPASVAHNWIRELKIWCPKLDVVLYHGSKQERVRLQPTLKRAGVVVATYTMFEKSSGSDDRRVLRKIRWNMLILDEGHCIKNAASGRTRNLRKLRSYCRLILTGTPIQNDLPELLAMLAFLMPSVFDPSAGQLATLFEDARTAKDDREVEHRIRSVKKIFRPFFLRRVKDNVLEDLAPKSERVEFLDMPEEQSKMYASVLRSADRILDDEKSVMTAADRKKARQRRVHIFSELRKAANHPLLLRQRFGRAGDKLARIAQELHSAGAFGFQCSVKRVREEIEERMSDFALHQMCSEYADDRPWLRTVLLSRASFGASAKFLWLRKHLPEMLRRGDRVLIFSQWTTILDILEVFLDTISIAYYRIDGSTAVSERQPLIDAYNAPGACVDVFLLSTRAGGMGINLTSANTVIMHDGDFNPQNDMQAQDRCHRIGQKRAVTIFRLITSKSVDVQIMRIADRKRSLHNALLLSPTPKERRSTCVGKSTEHADIATALEAAVNGNRPDRARASAEEAKGSGSPSWDEGGSQE